MRISKPSLTAADLDRDLNLKPGSIDKVAQNVFVLQRAAKPVMSPEELRLQKLSFVRGMTGKTDEEIMAVAPELRPCPTCADLRTKLQSSAMDCLAIDGQAMDLLTENKTLKDELARVEAQNEANLEAELASIQRSIQATAKLKADRTRLRTALTAISRATTLIQAAQIAEGALRGDVGTATPDVV